MTDVRHRIKALSPEKRALLEKELMRRSRDPEGTPHEEIGRRQGPGPWPLSFPQQRLWFLEQWAPGEPTYNAVLAMRIHGPLDVERLRRAFEAIIARHESLRTVFTDTDGAPAQRVLEARGFELPVVDLRNVPEEMRETEMLQLGRAEARRAFDLSADLMLRALALRIGNGEHVLVIVEHHIAFDGWSDGQLFRELGELYVAAEEGRPARLPDLPLQYADFAVWQRERMQGEVLERHVSYWRERLAGAPPCIRLPTDHPRPPVQSYEGAHHHFTLPPRLAAAVREFGRSERATPFMTLLAAFAALLYRWTDEHDILIGSPIANRDRVELEHLIGFFSNTLVLRVGLTGQPTFRELVRRTREVALGAYEHQDLPFERVVEAVRPPRSPAYNPLFQVNFRVQSGTPESLRLPGLDISRLDLDVGFSRFDLALELQLGDNDFTGYLEYNHALFESTTAERVARQFVALLSEAVVRPDRSIAELDLERTRATAPAIRGSRRR